MILRPNNSITRNTVILPYDEPNEGDTGVKDVLYLFGKYLYRWDGEWIALGSSEIELADSKADAFAKSSANHDILFIFPETY